MGSIKKNRKSPSMVITHKKRKTSFWILSLAVVLIITVVTIVVATSRGNDAGNTDLLSNVSENNSVGQEGSTLTNTGGQEQAGQSSGPVKATWIEPRIDGSSVAISIGRVEQEKNTHFGLGQKQRNMNFMAYRLGEDIHVRANVCPPCRSIGFSLDGDELVCDKCRTRFQADSGAGISGACRDYPKANVGYEINGGEIVMQMDDLTAAYEDTVRIG